jgi:hypothetical protein
MSAQERAQHDQAVAAARAALGEEKFEEAWAQGHTMTPDEALDSAIEGID